jgi:hypothetical protein
VAHSVTWSQSGGITTVRADLDGNIATTEFVLSLTGLKTLTAADFLL